ncbi:hypothetical protein [Ornithinimicrobium murale]|uniref:hypothetical protein n=1 Tax=Ornithinimicrobium murale TaxID=1050153 RepID=UPI000E0DE1C0|nr:hypothetical protein [Ornithinimicrobium murale]
MSFKESLSRWGASKLSEVSTHNPGDFALDTIDVEFDYEKPWSYSEHTGGGGVASVKVTGYTNDGDLVQNVLAEESGDLSWSLSNVAGQIAEFDDQAFDDSAKMT